MSGTRCCEHCLNPCLVAMLGRHPSPCLCQIAQVEKPSVPVGPTKEGKQ